MTHDVAPAADDLLCENCGYLLNGLPPEGNCPECGTPIALSTVASHRTLPAWEAGRDEPIQRFRTTATAVLLSPNRFFRTLSVRGDVARSRAMAVILMIPLVLVDCVAVVLHYTITFKLYVPPSWLNVKMMLPLLPIVVAASWALMFWAVVHLTVLEARYWGLRLRTDVVRRAMHYLAIHAIAASLLPLLVNAVYLCMVVQDDSRFGLYMAQYLYLLCGSIVIAALYLFMRYWRAMQAMMNANV